MLIHKSDGKDRGGAPLEIGPNSDCTTPPHQTFRAGGAGDDDLLAGFDRGGQKRAKAGVDGAEPDEVVDRCPHEAVAANGEGG